jgi:hypothetical protein
LAAPDEARHGGADRALDHRGRVRALEVAQRGRFIRAQPMPPGLQEKQLERLAQNRRRLRERVRA